MNGDDYIVPPLSWDAIEDIAGNVRQVLKLQEVVRFPVMEVIERVLDQKLGLLEVQVGSRAEMGSAEGSTCPRGTFIRFRGDVYEAAWKGDEGRARFTAAHELGHWVMHANQPLRRVALRQRVAPFRRAEPQANRFAAALLMPFPLIKPDDTPLDLMLRFGVSHEAAEVRLRSRKRGRQG